MNFRARKRIYGKWRENGVIRFAISAISVSRLKSRRFLGRRSIIRHDFPHLHNQREISMRE